MKRVERAGLLGVAVAMTATACINLDQADQIKDLRVLAVKLDPPEILFSFFHLFDYEERGGFPLGPYPMTAQALVVDPQGRPVEVSLRLCPEAIGLGNPDYGEACEGYVVRSNAPNAEMADVLPLVAPRTVRRNADQALGGELVTPSFPMVYSDRALDYMLPHDADGNFDLFSTILFPSFPSVVVRAHVPGTSETEVAFKRFVLALDISPEGVPPELSASLQDLFTQIAGVSFCPPEVGVLDDVQCIKRRRVNHNPVIQRVLYKMGPSIERTNDPKDLTAAGQLKDLPQRLVVAPGDEVRLRVTVRDEDLEPYQGFGIDLQTLRLRLENYVEDIAFSWFTTVGSIQGPTTTQFAPNADNVWQISADTPDGPAFVWVVVRDQRGGVDWRRLDFEVVTPPPSGGGGGPFGINLPFGN